MYPTVTILDGATTTTLCHGMGQRTVNEWRLEGDIEAPAAFTCGEPIRPLRAVNSTPPGRAMRESRVTFSVGRIYSDLAAAYEARLTLPNTCPVKGTLYINVSATRRVSCANAQIESCNTKQNGLFVGASYSFLVGAVTAETY